jgi:hypothetical protein
MAAREFHGVIENKWENVITWVTDEVDGGQWQDPWYPSRKAGVIRPGEEGEWRSESGGDIPVIGIDVSVATGTSGWALWSTAVGDHTEFIRVSWNVPFFGVVDIKGSTYRYDPRDSGSVFRDTTPPSLGILPIFSAVGGDEPLLAEAATTFSMALVGQFFTTSGPITHPRIGYVVQRVRQSQKLEPTTPPRLVADGVNELVWTVPSLSCGTAGGMIFTLNSAALRTLIEGKGLVHVRNAGGQRLEIINVRRLSPDPAQMFRPERITVRDKGQPAGAYEISVTATPNAFYEAAPYALELQIESNGGTLTVNLGTLPPIDDNLAARIRSQALQVFNDCNMRIDKWFSTGSKLGLIWTLPDPPPDGRPVDRLWLVQAVGLAPGSIVRIERDELDRVVGTAIADSTSEARLGLISHPSKGNIGIVLERNTGPTEAGDLVGVSTSQVELVQVGELQFSRPFRELTGIHARGHALAVAIEDQMLEARGINPTFDETAWKLPIEGLAGCAPGRDLLLAWGTEGLLLITIGGEVLEKVHEAPVTAVALSQNLVWVLDRNYTLTIYHSRSFQQVNRVEVPGTTAIAGAGTAVALISAGRLKSAWLDRENCQIQMANADIYDIEVTPEHQLRSALVTSGLVLVGTCDDGNLLISFRNPERPVLVARYNEIPWFLACTQIGRYWVYRSAQEDKAVVAITGRTVTTL